MSLPEPLPGTHLARVDCTECGTYVLAVPAYADRALCTACGRQKAGAETHDVSPPPHWFGLSESTPRVELVAARVAAQALPWTAVCPKCRWTAKLANSDDVILAHRNHHRVAHDPKGWASGVTGGLRR